MKTALILIALLSGCALTPGAGCVTVQTVSLKVTDAQGNVKFNQAPDTVKYCPPSISAAP